MSQMLHRECIARTNLSSIFIENRHAAFYAGERRRRRIRILDAFTFFYDSWERVVHCPVACTSFRCYISCLIENESWTEFHFAFWPTRKQRRLFADHTSVRGPDVACDVSWKPSVLIGLLLGAPEPEFTVMYVGTRRYRTDVSHADHNEQHSTKKKKPLRMKSSPSLYHKVAPW